MRNSNSIISAAVAFSAILGIGAASAADLPARTYTKAPAVVAPVYDWSGFYIGGDVGGYWNRESAITTASPAGFGAPAVFGAALAGFGINPMSHNLKKSGALGGLYAGYNWQAAAWVFGLEGDFSYLGRTNSDTEPLIATFPGATNPRGFATVTDNSRWLGSIRGRVGYTWNSFMLYGTGGVAFIDGKDNMAVVPAGVGLNGFPGGAVNFNSNQVGWVAGVGGEWLFANNWMFRLEYLHYGFGGASGSLAVVADTCTVAAACAFNTSISNRDIDTVRVGVSYKFGGPVVAKY
jgi:outer membrane immunogenic protein